MTGLYVPFWVVDCNIDAHWGLAKKSAHGLPAITTTLKQKNTTS